MPGITGIISKRPVSDFRAAIQKMVECMKHETFYNVGTYVNETLGVSSGWACLQGSYSDCLPVWNESKDICLLFSGEHFAEREDLERLKARHQFDGSNASFLVHLYEEEGSRFFESLNGSFSGLVLDLRENKTILFNDRYGLQRIYLHEAADAFYFSSEAKSLLKVLPQLRSLDMQGLGEYFSCGSVMQNRTLFKGIHLLPAGSMWTFSPGQSVRKETYFKKETWERQEELPVEEYYEHLRETFVRILPKYFQGKQQVAMSLTGGLDSRMIMAASNPAPGTLKCYSVSGMYRECADAKVGRQIAGIFKQPHQVINVDRGFFSAFPEMAMRTVYYTDGALDAVGSAGMYAHRQAREIAGVRMTGNYGGEVLRGLVMFKSGYLSDWLFSPDFVPHYKNAEKTYAAERQGKRTSFILFKQVPWHHYARFAMESALMPVRSPFLDNELVRLAFRAPEEPRINKELAHRLIEDCCPVLRGLPTDRGTSKRPAIVPHSAWEWWKEFLPKAEYAFDYGMPQWLVRADRLLGPTRPERLFLGIQKYCHFRTWYRHELAPFVKEVALDLRTLSRPYWNAKNVEAQVKGHVNGSANCTVEIHKLLATEFIQRTLIEQN